MPRECKYTTQPSSTKKVNDQSARKNTPPNCENKKVYTTRPSSTQKVHDQAVRKEQKDATSPCSSGIKGYTTKPSNAQKVHAQAFKTPIFAWWGHPIIVEVHDPTVEHIKGK